MSLFPQFAILGEVRSSVQIRSTRLFRYLSEKNVILMNKLNRRLVLSSVVKQFPNLCFIFCFRSIVLLLTSHQTMLTCTKMVNYPVYSRKRFSLRRGT